MARTPILHVLRVAAAFTAIGALGCSRRDVPPIRIALLAITEGTQAVVSGTPSRDGANLAVEEINAAGGVLVGGVRRRVEIVLKPYADRPDAAADAAREAINVDGVDAIVGPQFSSHALAVATIAEQSQVPMITPMASAMDVTAGRRFVFRLAFVDTTQGFLLARYVVDSLRIRRPAVLYDASSSYANGIVKLFTSTAEARGARVVATETFLADGGTDFRPQLRRLLAHAPDALLLPSFAAMDSFQVRQARELGFRGRFLGTDRWDPVSLGRLPEVEGTIVVSNWSPKLDRKASREFVDRYQRRFQVVPRSTAAGTYDAFHLIAAAISAAGSVDGARVAGRIGETRSYEGALATYRFRNTGDPDRTGLLLLITDGHDSLLSSGGSSR